MRRPGSNPGPFSLWDARQVREASGSCKNDNDHEREGARTSGVTLSLIVAVMATDPYGIRGAIATCAKQLARTCDDSIMTATPLFTIGYEQATPAAVLGELKRAKVKLLVDTRAVAASRRPGFSKRQLAAALDEQGIGYLHLQKLGTPAEGRQAARSGDLDTLWRIYDKHIKTRGRAARRSTN